MKKQQGNAYIEIFIVMILVFFMLPIVLDWTEYTLQDTQQSYYQTLAIEQLQGLSILVRLFPVNFQTVIDDVSNRTNILLPKAALKIHTVPEGHRLEIEWIAGGHSTWHCSRSNVSGYSCLELKVQR